MPEGELTVILGPNACGKSTTLKALARVNPLKKGEVRLDGTPLPADEVPRYRQDPGDAAADPGGA